MSGSVAFNSPSLRAGRSVLSQILTVPAGCIRCDVIIDGSGWPPESKVKVSVQVRCGDKFKRHGEIITSREELINGKCHVGVFSEQKMTQAMSVRGSVRVVSGPRVDVIGCLKYG